MEHGFKSFSKSFDLGRWCNDITFRFVCQSLGDLRMHHLVEAVKALSLKCGRPGFVPTCVAGAPGCLVNIGNTLRHEGCVAGAVLCPLSALAPPEDASVDEDLDRPPPAQPPTTPTPRCGRRRLRVALPPPPPPPPPPLCRPPPRRRPSSLISPASPGRASSAARPSDWARAPCSSAPRRILCKPKTLYRRSGCW